MHLRDIEAKRVTLQKDRVKRTEELIAKLQVSQQQTPSESRQLMLESLEFRRDKLEGK